ncbi:hypothetical protein ZTR_04109 [Talaromyces verruculosus]|nr:hypothetical protein ZTR_04109 [Talaromyces verruculosus]
MTRPSTCCGQSTTGCVCAAQARCECGKTTAEQCDCSKKAAHDPHSEGARCSCRMRPAGQYSCTCEKVEKIDAAVQEGLETDFTTKA